MSRLLKWSVLTMAVACSLPYPAGAADDAGADKAREMVEAFVGSGRVRATDLALMGVLAERLQSAAPACRYILSKLTAETQRRLVDGEWRGLEDPLAAELDQLLDDEPFGRFADAYSRRLPAGLSEWLSTTDATTARRRRNRVLLDQCLAPALSHSGPVRYEGTGKHLGQFPAMYFTVAGREVVAVAPDASLVLTSGGWPNPRAFSKRWTPQEALAWAQRWVTERHSVPDWAEAVWSAPKLDPPIAITAGEAPRPVEEDGIWRVNWHLTSRGVRLDSGGSVVLYTTGAAMAYYCLEERPTVSLEPAVSAEEALRLALEAAPDGRFGAGELALVCTFTGLQQLQWQFKSVSPRIDVVVGAANGSAGVAYRAEPPPAGH